MRSDPRGRSLGLRGMDGPHAHRMLAYFFVTRDGSIESFPSAHAPTTTSAAILTPVDGYGGSPAAAPTPLAGAKSGDFEVEACPVGS